MYKMYSFFFDFGLLAAAEQIGAFYKDIFALLFNNLPVLVLFFVPLIVFPYFKNKIDFITTKNKKSNLVIATTIVIIFVFIYQPSYQATDLSIINRGVIATFLNDFKQEEEIELIGNINDAEITEEIIEEEEAVFLPQPQILNIDFTSQSGASSSYQKLNEFFAEAEPTYTNEMSGIFKDKNLILILGESFNSIAVKEDLMPTLYKLINEGFTFTNYYSSSYNSTLGGEFQLQNGMYAQSSVLGTWKAGTNYFPFGLGNCFSSIQYSVNAYHDHDYSYMERNTYLKAVGFDNYLGCWNGLEKRMKCGRYFDLDSEVPEATMADYLDNEKFFAYYVTISGHGPYNYQTTVGPLHRQELIDKGYNYSEKVMCYLSAMIELDQMLENMLTILEAENKLDNTVIMVVGDHYPYYLNTNEFQELGYDYQDEVVDVCKNDLIIYNSATPKVNCEKVGNTMDVLATIYNLFGIEYDSRLIVGKDLFSDAPGFAYFGNGSWVSDYGTYYAHLGKFVPNNKKEVSEDYFVKANSYARTQMSLTALIFNNNYYQYVFDNLIN